jgi:carbon-monoxide dehydrogenase small subunit
MSVREAHALLPIIGKRRVLYAAGTDLLLATKEALLPDDYLINIQSIAGLEVVRDPCRQHQHEVQVEPYETPMDRIRDRLGLTGTKKSSDMQDYGACMVFPDGRPVSSCTLVAFEARNSPLLTIEGMAQGENLHPIQEAFIACSRFQCGFRPPDMILATRALLDENPHPTVGEISHY